MSEKINVGQALEGENGMVVQLNLDALLEALELPEVQLSLTYFTGKGNKPQRKIKLFISQLQPEYVNKYQTHSVRIDTYFRKKE